MSTETDNTYNPDCNDDACSNEICQWHRAAEIMKLREEAEKNAEYTWASRVTSY
jgi:hypothetical protein